jgi:hypothetical protein
LILSIRMKNRFRKTRNLFFIRKATSIRIKAQKIGVSSKEIRRFLLSVHSVKKYIYDSKKVRIPL